MRVVVITGASAGIGRAAARKFAEEQDIAIALLARGRAGLDAAAKEVEAAGVKALPIVVDVADNDAMEAAAERIESELGPIDVWVNNAFSSVFAEFLDVTPEEFERTTDVTYMGFVNGTRAALKRMKPRDRGVIVQVGSALAYRGIPLQVAYCGAKHAIQGFSEALRSELMHNKSDVHITMVQLAAMNTPQFDWVLSRLPRRAQPVPPIYQPEVAAAVIVKASKGKRREWWVGGSVAKTVIANAIAPGLLDRYVARVGVDSQQTDEPTSPDRPSNLFAPVDDDSDFGAHGSFDDVAKRTSLQVKASTHRRILLSGAGVATVAGAIVRSAWAAR